jgi:hypothetical protein
VPAPKRILSHNRPLLEAALRICRNYLPCGVLTLGFVFVLGQAVIARQTIPDTERDLFNSLNRERAARRLSTLKWDEGLSRAARKHAELMAEENIVLHQLPGEPDLITRAQDAGASFSHITENIGRSVDADQFHEGWMRSPGHRANMLEKSIDSVGIAVVEAGKDLFAVEDFSLALAPLSFEEQEKQVAGLIAARGLRLLGVDNDARMSCGLDQDYAGSRKPRYVAHYETPVLSPLPDQLDKELRSHRYKRAIVAACARKDSTGPARFRIVVLLY